jgi:hypothetical protein
MHVLAVWVASAMPILARNVPCLRGLNLCHFKRLDRVAATRTYPQRPLASSKLAQVLVIVLSGLSELQRTQLLFATLRCTGKRVVSLDSSCSIRC